MKIYSIICCLLLASLVLAQEETKPVISKEQFKNFDYNRLGLLRRVSTLDEHEFELLYNDKNKITTLIERNGVDLAKVINYDYNSQGNITDVELEGLGTVESIYDEDGKIFKTYSDEGHLLAGYINEAMGDLKQMRKKQSQRINPKEELEDFFLSSNINHITIYQKNGVWKYILDKDTNKLLVPHTFDYCSKFYEGISIIKKGKAYGAISKQGKIILPMNNDYVGLPNKGLMRVLKNGKWSFVNLQGKIVLPAVYNYCYDFEGDYAKVKFEDGWSFIDREGDKVLSQSCENVFMWTKDILVIQSGGKNGLTRLSGEILVEPKFDYISRPKKECEMIRIRSGRLWGTGSFKDDKFSIQASPQYHKIDKKKLITTIVENGRKSYGLLAENGSVLLEATYSHIFKKYINYDEQQKLSPPQVYHVHKGDLKGVFTAKQGFITPIKFRSTLYFLESEEKDCICQYKADSFSIVCFDSIQQVEGTGSVFIVEQKGKKGLFTSNGNRSILFSKVLPINFEEMKMLSYNSIVAKEFDKWKCYNVEKDSFLDIDIQSFVLFNMDKKSYEVGDEKINQAIVKTAKGYQVVVNGKLSPIFQSVESIGKTNHSIVKKDEKYGIFQNSEMKYYKEPSYDKIWIEDDAVHWAKASEKGIFNTEFEYPFLDW